MGNRDEQTQCIELRQFSLKYNSLLLKFWEAHLTSNPCYEAHNYFVPPCLLASRLSWDTVCLSSSAISSAISSSIQARVTWCSPVTNSRASPLAVLAFHSILACEELDAVVHSYFASSPAGTWWGPEMETAEGGSEHNTLSIVSAWLLAYSEL